MSYTKEMFTTTFHRTYLFYKNYLAKNDYDKKK